MPRQRQDGLQMGGSWPAPVPIAGAVWQAGISPGNANLRVLLDGEPVPLAIAAKPGPRGWVKRYDDPRREPILEASREHESEGRVFLPRGPDGETRTKTERGDVRIVSGDRY